MKLALLALVLLLSSTVSASQRWQPDRRHNLRERKLIATLDAFFQKWAAHDVEGVVAFFADDAVYHPVPFPAPSVGKDAIRATLAQFFPAFGYMDLGAYHFIVDGNVVAVERIDTFEVIPTGKTGVFPIAGVFTFDRQGKITRWNDYFDARTFEKQTDLLLPQ